MPKPRRGSTIVRRVDALGRVYYVKKESGARTNKRAWERARARVREKKRSTRPVGKQPPRPPPLAPEERPERRPAPGFTPMGVPDPELFDPDDPSTWPDEGQSIDGEDETG